ncbi:MAG: hypothetical protein SW833_09330 [Cyanobacteriota bacterium]|nr:hypothetical protein [Cyanobacteriota bacterium]
MEPPQMLPQMLPFPLAFCANNREFSTYAYKYLSWFGGFAGSQSNLTGAFGSEFRPRANKSHPPTGENGNETGNLNRDRVGTLRAFEELEAIASVGVEC